MPNDIANFHTEMKTTLGRLKEFSQNGRLAEAALYIARLDTELLPNLGDGRGQAAAWGCCLTASIPSTNFTPWMSLGNWLCPLRRRQLFSAAWASVKIMASAVLLERPPFERTVRCRTVAKLRIEWGWRCAGASSARPGSHRRPAASCGPWTGNRALCRI